MKFISKCLMFCLILVCSAHALAKDYVVLKSQADEEKANVYDSPSSEDRVVNVLSPGGKFELIESIPYFYHVRTEDGKTGYISKKSTKLVNIESIGLSEVRAYTPNNLDIHFIDVGQGDSTLINCPNGKKILIDAGTTSSGYEVEDIREYILSNIERVDDLIITHPDIDHYSLLPDILEGVQIDQIWRVGDLQNDYGSKFRTWYNAESLDKITKIVGKTYYDGPDIHNPRIDCGDANIYILAGNVEVSGQNRKNASSIVILVEYNQFKAIFTGDATFETEDEILKRYDSNLEFLDVDLLKLGHHGSSKTSSSKRWIDTLKPEISVASAGYDSVHGHPRKEVIDRVEKYAADSTVTHKMTMSSGSKGNYRWHTDDNYDYEIYNTAVNGTIFVSTNGIDYKISINPSDE